ncbi:FHA domain-containing protein [Curtobacterium sp. UCD-KPL2560]|uniref:FHA domain-containing protein n=1 Tax=Curtobacterium sp. UCD-KPL2560 TaxID=1885315 RepID=UPI0008269DC7|nr:FHA domain-containing protein [Curtobacterium sp. UCD-KPL2560]
MQRDTNDGEVPVSDVGARAGVEQARPQRALVEAADADRRCSGGAADDTVLRAARPSVVTGPDRDDLGDTVIVARSFGAAGSPGAGGSPDDTIVRSRHDDTVLVSRPPHPLGTDQTTTGGRPDHRVSGLQTGVPGTGPTATRTRVPSVRVGGRTVRLDRPVVVGRRPSPPRVLTGPGPELVTVPSPSGQVSSSHVALHAEGEAVVVEDLRSTNGTVIRPAGAAASRMPAGASIVVLTGTLVEIGDGNVIEVLSPHLRVGSSDRLPPVPSAPVTG